MVYDPLLQQVMAIGGSGIDDFVLAFDGSRWTHVLSGATSGPTLSARDPVRGRTMAVAHFLERGLERPIERSTRHFGLASSPRGLGGGCQQTALDLIVWPLPRLGFPCELSVWDHLPRQTPRRHAPVVWLFGPGADLPLGPCRLGVDPLRAVVVPGVTNAYAFAGLCLYIPVDLALSRTPIHTQAAIADPASPIGITFSRTRQQRVGW